MKQVPEMPTSGQFVMIFIGSTGLCADTLWWDEGKLESLMMSDSLDDEEWAAEWNERVGITDKRTQIQEIAAWLAKQDNGADSALILAFEKEHAELLSLVQDLKACLLSMTPTDFTDAEFYKTTLDKTNQIILKHSGF